MYYERGYSVGNLSDRHKVVPPENRGDYRRRDRGILSAVYILCLLLTDGNAFYFFSYRVGTAAGRGGSKEIAMGGGGSGRLLRTGGIDAGGDDVPDPVLYSVAYNRFSTGDKNSAAIRDRIYVSDDCGYQSLVNKELCGSRPAVFCHDGNEASVERGQSQV